MNYPLTPNQVKKLTLGELSSYFKLIKFEDTSFMRINVLKKGNSLVGTFKPHGKDGRILHWSFYPESLLNSPTGLEPDILEEIIRAQKELLLNFTDKPYKEII